jgi:hypothetical protein
MPIPPKSGIYMCAEFDAAKDLRLAEKSDVDFRLEAPFDPPGSADTTLTLLGSPDTQGAVDELTKASTQRNAPTAFPVYAIPARLMKRAGQGAEKC